MDKELNCYFRVSPAVVPANKASKVCISCFEPKFGFKEGVKYIIDIIPASIMNVPFSQNLLIPEIAKNFERAEAVAHNGTLCFEYNFKNEQKWTLHIFSSEKTAEGYEKFDPQNDGWIPLIKNFNMGIRLEMYSLDADLYELRPYKGDLHLHSNCSDGAETPETVAANYRKEGFDFISITDHHKYGSSELAMKKLQGLDTRFTLYSGEEVHNDDFGQIHIINFDSKSSVNDRILGDERPAILAEIEKIKNSEALKDCFDKNQIAWRIWIYNAIKESGGLCIFPHPYWTNFGVDHASREMIDFTFEHHLLDAFEVHGGTTHNGNNLQALLYHEMKAKGYDYPIVASTDAHTTRKYGISEFGCAYTVAFARNAHSVRDAILGGYTVGVLNNDHIPNLTGSVRLAKYASFLIENYFPYHDELCHAAGLMMHKYVTGDKGAKAACDAIEGYIAEHETEFFGK